MLGKNRKYKGLDFSDTIQKHLQQTMGYSFPLQEYSADLSTRTEERTNANFHGGTLSHSLYGVRYMNFSWIGIGKSKQERGIVLKLLMDQLTLRHGVKSDEYFDLSRETDDGQPRTCKAKITKPIETRHELTSYKFEYSFQLACPSEKIYAPTQQLQKISRGFFGGTPLAQSLPVAIGSFGGGGKILNEGNWYAPFKLQIIWTCTNPKIFNLATGESIRIQATTTNLIFDNRNLNFEEGKDWILEDLGQDISSKRSTGKDLYLAPGENQLVVITDNPDEEPEIFVTRRSTFNY